MSRAPYKTLTQSVVENLRARILKGESEAGPALRPRTLALVEQINLSCDRYLQLELRHSRQALIAAEREHDPLLQLCRQRRTFEAAALLKQHIEAAGQSIKQPLNSR